MMEDLFGNPVEEVVHDDAAEIKRNLADAQVVLEPDVSCSR